MREKINVAVNFTLYPDGIIVPEYIEWVDGDRFEIDKFEKKGKQACELGDKGILFKCVIRGRKRELYFDESNFVWFVVAAKNQI